MNCCTNRCGHCGRCESEPRHSTDRAWFPCDYTPCGNAIGPQTGSVSVANQGIYCSHKCASAAKAELRRKAS